RLGKVVALKLMAGRPTGPWPWPGSGGRCGPSGGWTTRTSCGPPTPARPTASRSWSWSTSPGPTWPTCSTGPGRCRCRRRARRPGRRPSGWAPPPGVVRQRPGAALGECRPAGDQRDLDAGVHDALQGLADLVDAGVVVTRDNLVRLD